MALVTRNHPKLTLEGARAVLAAAQRRAEEIHVPMDIAVVDDGGHLLVFERMDGARPSSIAISMVKAQAAALRRASHGPPDGGRPSESAARVGPGDCESIWCQTPIRGGVPLIVDGQVVGAVGASAGTEDQDVDVARAGAAAIEKA